MNGILMVYVRIPLVRTHLERYLEVGSDLGYQRPKGVSRRKKVMRGRGFVVRVVELRESG